jgi:hypothetical protein
MKNKVIYFTCALFAMLAVTAVTAQDNSTILDNSTMNNTSANDTLPVQNETAPVSNETASASNDTEPAVSSTTLGNALLAPESISASSPSPAPIAIGSLQKGSSQKSVFAISNLINSPATFSIENQPLHKEAYEVGLPAETIMDLSALPFYLNNI